MPHNVSIISYFIDLVSLLIMLLKNEVHKTCEKCGAEIHSNDKFCSECGNVTNIIYENKVKKDIVTKKRKEYIGRMIIGLVSIVLSLLVLLQSCAAGVYNTMSETGDLGSSAGFLVFLIMMIAGIVAIATRKSEKKKTGIIIGAIYIFGGFIAFPHSVVFTDLKIWGGVCIFFGLYFLGSFLYADDEEEKIPIFEFKCDKCSTTVKRGDTICPECGAEVSTKIKPIDVIKLVGSFIAGLLILSLVCYVIYTDFIAPKEYPESISPSDIKVATEESQPIDYEYNTSSPIEIETVEQLYETSEFDNKKIRITGEVGIADQYYGTLKMYGAHSNAIAILEGSESYDIEEFERVTVIGTLLKDEYGGAIIVVESIEVQDDGAINRDN